MSYEDFVWFILSEEDKSTPRAVEYWFRVLDTDGDGILSLFELEFFYDELLERLRGNNIDPVAFRDCACQMLDLVHPKDINRITLADLKRCKLVPVFFNTFLNMNKYLDFEQRDPSSQDRADDNQRDSDWIRFARREYDALTEEEEQEDPENDEQEDNSDTNDGEAARANRTEPARHQLSDSDSDDDGNITSHAQRRPRRSGVDNDDDDDNNF
jgi:serine/threonine-protein phosphatase 2A regulatory subunit B''